MEKRKLKVDQGEKNVKIKKEKKMKSKVMRKHQIKRGEYKQIRREEGEEDENQQIEKKRKIREDRASSQIHVKENLRDTLVEKCERMIENKEYMVTSF